MFGFGLGELVVIAAIGILVLGPERCIDLFKKAGTMWRNVRAEVASTKDLLEDRDDSKK